VSLSILFRAIAVTALFLSASTAQSGDATTAPPAEAQATADKIAGEIAQIRGLTFKNPVRVETQSAESFSEFVSRQLDKEIPQSIRNHYGIIVRTLGLYRGPPIEDFASLMKSVMTSQIGAYYDPEKQGFYVVMTGMPEMMPGVMYSHELYHALQDQYFGLERYMDQGRKGGNGSANADSQIARSAVVEGEATYMMSLWMIQRMTHKPPTREMMTKVVAMQSNMSMDQLRQAMKQPEMAEMVGSDIKDAINAANEIPAFIMDSMVAVYLKGLGFVFAVHEQGWSAVEKLYNEYPPKSTEHILHPEKWLAREEPTAFEWPKFEKIAALRDWELLDDDVLGEFQWRIVLREQGLAAEAESVAAGWDGDRYAVFKRKDSNATLLLMRTRWDSEKEAKEFYTAYRKVLATKYADAPVPTLVSQKGVDVFVVEGGDEAKLEALMKVVKHAKSTRL
jgi:hypothetical protein